MLFGAVFLFAAILRFHDLEKRPMHGDEANQAIKTSILYDDGEYRYDPHEHHGPTLYFLALPFFHAAGLAEGNEAGAGLLRSVPAMAGLLSLLLLPLFAPALSRSALLWSALFMACSHGLVYYSRYYIQESFLILFILVAILCLYRYFLSGKLGWALGFGVGLGLMHATKETFIIPFAAMGASLMATGIWLQFRGALRFRVVWRTGHAEPGVIALPMAHGLLVLAVATVVSLSFYSSFFSYPRGMIDSLLSFTTYIERAEGTGSTADHDKPWYYYLAVLAHTQLEAGPRWTEGIVLGLAALGICLGAGKLVQRPRPEGEERATVINQAFLPFLACYTVLVTLAFSIIPYKTPWNLLPFLQPMTILAGIAAAWLTSPGAGAKPWRRALALVPGLLILAGTAFTTHQTWLGITRYAADTRNPYVYAHTSTAAVRMVRQVEELASLHPSGPAVRIDIIKPDGDYWPLPWYLRNFSQIGYWPAIPERVTASIIISEPRYGPAISEALGDRDFHVGMSSLRPNVNLVIFVERSLWDAYMASRIEP